MYRVSKKVLFEMMHERKIVRLHLKPNNTYNKFLRIDGYPIEFMDGKIAGVSISPNNYTFHFRPWNPEGSVLFTGSNFIDFDFKDIRGIEYLE